MIMSLKELVAELNALKITQTNSDWYEDIPVDIWDKYFDNRYDEVASGIQVETYRWYEISITVIKMLGGLLGIRHITNIFSESMDHEDCYETYQFDEMNQVQTVAYECVQTTDTNKDK